MSQVYIILAHKKPEQLYRMVRSLHYADTKFIIHIDAKCDITPFETVFAEVRSHCFFLEKRVATNWGSFAMVEACLNALNYICEYITDAERVTLLSGQDYPIKPASYIHRFFEDNKDKIYLNHFRIPTNRWSSGGETRFPNFPAISQMIDIYGGSQWWSFPMYLVKRMLADLEDYTDFITYFQQVVIPDESFFQCLVLNYEDKQIMSNIVNDNLQLTSWHFPYKHPRILVARDLTAIKESKHLFARKFDTSVDDRILDQIDQLLSGDPPYRVQQQQPSQAILFLSNKTSSFNRFAKLQKEIPENGQAFFLFHENTEKMPLRAPIDESSIFKFSDAVLTNLGFTSLTPKLLPGSNHFPLFSFFNTNPNFDYYWIIEDDVYFNGDWRLFFDSFSPEHTSSDFLSSRIRFYEQDPYWYWWDTFKNKNEGIDNNMSTHVASFNPIYRLSREAIIYLKKQMESGWMGHHEVLIPTLLCNAGLSIMDFGGDGSFCPPKNFNRYYKHLSCEVHNRDTIYSMRYRPLISPTEITEAILYHPVKFDVSENQ